MTHRESCGTATGARLHHAAGEALCGECAHRQRVLILQAERAQPETPEPEPKRALHADLDRVIGLLAAMMLNPKGTQ